MKIMTIVFDGVPLKVPVVSGIAVEFPAKSFNEFGTYCGAGQGFGDWIVPDRILGLSISPACYIHDTMWALADATEEDFDESNRIFLDNTLATINTRSKSRILKVFRRYRAMSYYNAVTTVGRDIFFDLKAEKEEQNAEWNS